MGIMRKLMFGVFMLGLASQALAIEKTDLDYRIRLLTTKFQEMQAKPETAIPPEILQKAKGIVLMDRTKAGFLFAFQGGGGVALAREEDTGAWSAPAFVGASEVSLGFQAGGEQGFYVFVMLNTNALRMLTVPNYEYGSEARGTAGDASGGPETKTGTIVRDLLIFSDRRGLFGGADVSAGAIQPDTKANFIYYGRPLSTADILFGNSVEATEPANSLIHALDDQSKSERIPTSASR